MANGHDNHDHGYEIDRVPPDLLGQMGYETRDVGPVAILRWIAGLFVFIAIVTFGTLLLMNNFIPETGRVAYESEIFRTRPIRNNPMQPQLQTLPKRDMIMYRRDEKRVVDGYSATSEGRVSIPVNEAIDAIAKEGIAGVKAAAPESTTDAYPGSGKYVSDATTTAEAPRTEDGAEAQTATPDSGRATDVLTEERKNVPNEAHEQGGHGTEN
ncbi:MAG: hypothetical protein H8F28_09245 [Fibrella sp.]|nr:hypothetical protein [Armatimonadota bacterium]